MNPAQMQKMMKQMGMKMEEIDATDVVIRCSDCQIRIKRPQVVLADIMGKQVYQISGDETVEKLEPKEDDVKLIMEQTGKDKETVAKKLKEMDNDLARVIMELKQK
jgi:nascent polypeptide-associated complex subunit alpha